MGVLYNMNFQHLEMTCFLCQQNAWMDEEAMLWYSWFPPPSAAEPVVNNVVENAPVPGVCL